MLTTSIEEPSLCLFGRWEAPIKELSIPLELVLFALLLLLLLLLLFTLILIIIIIIIMFK